MEQELIPRSWSGRSISKDTFSSSFLEEQNLKNEYGLPLCHAGMPLIVWEESGKFEIWINLCRKIKWKKDML